LLLGGILAYRPLAPTAAGLDKVLGQTGSMGKVQMDIRGNQVALGITIWSGGLFAVAGANVPGGVLILLLSG
jgi:hypothetical protein